MDEEERLTAAGKRLMDNPDFQMVWQFLTAQYGNQVLTLDPTEVDNMVKMHYQYLALCEVANIAEHLSDTFVRIKKEKEQNG